MKNNNSDKRGNKINKSNKIAKLKTITTIVERTTSFFGLVLTINYNNINTNKMSNNNLLIV